MDRFPLFEKGIKRGDMQQSDVLLNPHELSVRLGQAVDQQKQVLILLEGSQAALLDFYLHTDQPFRWHRAAWMQWRSERRERVQQLLDSLHLPLEQLKKDQRFEPLPLLLLAALEMCEETILLLEAIDTALHATSEPRTTGQFCSQASQAFWTIALQRPQWLLGGQSPFVGAEPPTH